MQKINLASLCCFRKFYGCRLTEVQQNTKMFFVRASMLRKIYRKNQIPPHHQPKEKQERKQQLSLLQWYRKRTLKAKVSLWSILALILLLLGITVFQQSPLKHKTAGVHLSALSLSVKGAQIYNENNQPLLL